MIEVYDALRAAGVPDEKARAAAQAIAGYDSRFDHRFTLLQWMLGANLALTLTVLGILLNLLSRLPKALP